jgi:hypothetical protein
MITGFGVELPMFVTEEEAAAMYARACRSWYGAKAKSVVKSRIRELREKGDDKGVNAWRKVADALERDEKAKRLRTRRSIDKTSLLITRFRTTTQGDRDHSNAS